MASAPASTLHSNAGDLAFHARGFELSLASANKGITDFIANVERVTPTDE